MNVQRRFRILLMVLVLFVISACATLLGPETETEIPTSIPQATTVGPVPTEPIADTATAEPEPTEPPAVDTTAEPTVAEPTPVETVDYLPTAPGEPPLAPGSVSGSVCYPSEHIPPMTAYFVNTESGQTVEMSIAEDQTSYNISLPQGTYIAYAWLVDESLGGSFSAAVLCGLSVECTDHTPFEFQVLSGRTVTGIDLCDWYGDPGSVPQP